MPAYKAYLPALYSKGPQGARQEHMLKLDINEDRNPLG
jgi:D-glycerate 3-kinase